MLMIHVSVKFRMRADGAFDKLSHRQHQGCTGRACILSAPYAFLHIRMRSSPRPARQFFGETWGQRQSITCDVTRNYVRQLADHLTVSQLVA